MQLKMKININKGVILMYRSVKKGQWLINYRIRNEKIIELVNASKNFQNKGWLHDGGGQDDGFTGRS